MIDFKARKSLGGEMIGGKIVSPPPMLTIIDDDGHTDYKDYLLPFCKEMNAPIATAVTPMRFGGTSGVGRYMTLAEIKECHEDGAEVLCHTLTHTPDNLDIKHTAVVDGQRIDSTTFEDSDGNTVTGASDVVYHDTTSDKYYEFQNSYFSEIGNATIPDESALLGIYTDVSGYYDDESTAIYSTKEAYYTDKLAKYYNIAKSILVQNGLPDGNILVYNNNTGNTTLSRNASKRIFRCGFDLNGAQINQLGNIDRTCVHRYTIESSTNGYYGVSQMESMIDAVIASGGWLVWTMHTTGQEWRGTTSNDHTGIGREEVLNRLGQAIDYAHSKGLQIVTASYGCSAYIDGIA